jgi:hypothetical protein
VSAMKAGSQDETSGLRSIRLGAGRPASIIGEGVASQPSKGVPCRVCPRGGVVVVGVAEDPRCQPDSVDIRVRVMDLAMHGR